MKGFIKVTILIEGDTPSKSDIPSVSDIPDCILNVSEIVRVDAMPPHGDFCSIELRNGDTLFASENFETLASLIEEAVG